MNEFTGSHYVTVHLLEGLVGPAETRHVERIADWYVENHIIPNHPEIAPFVVDLSAR